MERVKIDVHIKRVVMEYDKKINIMEYLRNIAYNVTAFEYADKEANGELSKHQYKIAMTVLFGYCPDKLETRQVYQNCTKTSISFEEFLQWVRKKGFFKNSVIDAKTLFALLDNDFKGHVDIWDFYSASERTNLKVSKSIWRKAFNEMDQHNKGFLNLDELTLLMNRQLS